MSSFWADVSAELSAGRPVFLAFVVAHGRGSPGTAGARLALFVDGRQHGTIGGAIMEQRTLDAGLQRLADDTGRHDRPRLERLRHRRRDPTVIGRGESGLICAGWQQNVGLVLRPRVDERVAGELARRAEQERGSLRIDAAGLHLEDDDCGGDTGIRFKPGDDWCYQESLLQRRRVAILGGGHCGAALTRLMLELGWHVTLFERRSDLHTLGTVRESFIPVQSFDESASRLRRPEWTDAVVMTSDYRGDVDALAGCLRQPLRSIGVMGAPAKLRAIREALRTRGVSEAELERIRGPVGLPIGSDTPMEVAVSVAAELLQMRGTQASAP